MLIKWFFIISRIYFASCLIIIGFERNQFQWNIWLKFPNYIIGSALQIWIQSNFFINQFDSSINELARTNNLDTCILHIKCLRTSDTYMWKYCLWHCIWLGQVDCIKINSCKLLITLILQINQWSHHWKIPSPLKYPATYNALQVQYNTSIMHYKYNIIQV